MGLAPVGPNLKERNNIMKFFKKFTLAVAGLALAALCFTQDASALGYSTSFGITNCLQGTNQITTWPTNSVNGTNGLPLNTGHVVSIGNYDHFGLNFQGYLINTNAANTSFITFMLTGSMANNSPTLTFGTNVYSQNLTNILTSDFSATNNLLLVTIPLPPLYTNYFNWQTNITTGIASSYFADANYIGVYQISNNVPVGDVLTNTALYLNTKLLPRPLIGQ